MRRSFFGEMLGDSSAREVKLTRAFSACFAESQRFAAVVLDILAKRTDCSEPLHPSNYTCRPEVATERGRFDLLLESSRLRDPKFCLENKLGAPLTASQLTRYRGVDRRMKIVAVTKRPPEVGHCWLRDNGCFALRWQDVHEALGAARGLRGRDRFICGAFRDYLEDLEMAHATKLTGRGLQDLGRLFAQARSDRQYAAVDGAAAFERGVQCVDLVAEVMREAMDRRPVLREWSRSGPLYFKWRADGEDVDNVAFRFLRDGWKHWVGGAFEFRYARDKIVVAWINQAISPAVRSELDRRHKATTSNGKIVDAERLIELFLNDTKRYVGR
jgi:hypothetical protein